MQKLKSLFQSAAAAPRNACIAAAGVAMASPAFAEIDTAPIKTAIEANTGKGEEVGGYVIAAVIAFVVVTIIISMVKKA